MIYHFSRQPNHMKPMFTMPANKSIEDSFAKCRADELKELQSGKITVKWSQAHCGYRIRAGRNAVLGLQSFICEADAWEYLNETHGITRQ